MTKPTQVPLAIALIFAGAAVVSPHALQSATPQTLRVLFVGGDNTNANSLTEMVAAIAASKKDGPAIESATIASPPGATLASHVDQGTRVVSTLDDGPPWDFVVMEADARLSQALTPTRLPRIVTTRPVIGSPVTFHAAVRTLSAKVRARGGKPLLWTTWGFRDYPELQPELTKAVLDIGKELDIVVAPVAAAWLAARNDNGVPELFSDGQSPSDRGTYLAALTIYATLTGINPVGATGNIGKVIPRVPPIPVTLVDLDGTTARTLQEVAWSTVQSSRR